MSLSLSLTHSLSNYNKLPPISLNLIYQMNTQTAGNWTTFRRWPLQPRNTLANPANELPLKPSSFNAIPPFKLTRVDPSGKENSEITTALPLPEMSSGDFLLPSDALSLAEELVAARRQKERLRLEREKTETILRDRDLALEKEASEAERRHLEQIEVESKLQSLLRLIELRSLLRFDTISSLREQEEEKRKERLLMGKNCVSPARCEAEEAESSAAKEKGLVSSPISVSH